MSDYRHELVFGTFLTPQTRRPNDVVALAQRSEYAGLDLVTFQDHPYQPAFLDTWTLLSYVAARTERVHLSGNVIDLPLRNPAVLARSEASLDLLSGGRFELGIGAGAFWDSIRAMGGPRRRPADAVAAFSEALDIIHAIWDTAAPGGVYADGTHYRLHGAKRGPAPAHTIPIWVGALKPKMLQVLAEKADGWLPSLSYLSRAELIRSNQIIDESATNAGRDPHDIWRLLNITGSFDTRDVGFFQGPSKQWVEQLLPFVVEDGVATFILATDDSKAIDTWGHEVAPALRDAVAAERTSSPRRQSHMPADVAKWDRRSSCSTPLVAVQSLQSVRQVRHD